MAPSSIYTKYLPDLPFYREQALGSAAPEKDSLVVQIHGSTVPTEDCSH